MAVTIKLKNASGSDPSASDLVVGEVAIRTDNGKLFTKKDNGSVAEISGGGGIDDGDKGDITVSNSGDTFTIDNDVVTFAKMQNIGTPSFLGRNSSGTGNVENLSVSDVRTMLNVENGATADQTASEIKTLLQSDKLTASEIADGQINSAKIVDGSILNADINSSAAIAGSKINPSFTSGITITNTAPSLAFVDSNNNSDFTQYVDAGVFHIRDATNSQNRFSLHSNGDLTITNNLDVGAGVDVTGNITVSGTVDGRDVATDGSKLDGIESNATADQTASEILTLLKTVDGSGSGLDADLLDGISSGSFVRGDGTNNGATTITVNDADFVARDSTDSTTNFLWRDHSGLKLYLGTADAVVTARSHVNPQSDSTFNLGANGTRWANIYGDQLYGAGSNITGLNASNLGSGTVPQARLSASTLLTLIKTVDGSGSGLDADTLDGISSASFLRSDASDTATGEITLQQNSTSTTNFSLHIRNQQSAPAQIKFSNNATNQNGFFFYRHEDAESNSAANSFHFSSDQSSTAVILDQTAGNSGFYVGTNEVWHAGNDGSGSGLDADTLDGVNSASFLRSDTTDSASGAITFNGDVGFNGGAYAAHIEAGSDIAFLNGDWSGNHTKLQHHSNYLYMVGGSNGLILRHTNGSNRWQMNASGHFLPSSDSSYDVGTNGNRVRNGYFDTLYGDGSNLTGISAGATGGGSDEVFYENDQTVTTNYTITNGKNAMAAGPITINSGVTVTVGSGETLTIV